MSEKKQVSIDLRPFAEKKHSMQFKPNKEETDPCITALYIMNKALRELGFPKKVKVTITAED